MFGSLGFPELVFILVLALLIFGPRKLPEVGRTLGRALGEFRRATSDLKRSLDVELSTAEHRSPPKLPERPREERADDSPQAEAAGRPGAQAEPRPEPDGRTEQQGGAVEAPTAAAAPAGTEATGGEDAEGPAQDPGTAPGPGRGAATEPGEAGRS